MFENMLRDQLWQHTHSPTAQAINRMHGKVWVPEHPVFQPEEPGEKPWRPPGYSKPRGRSPIHTRFKRLDATMEKDAKARGFRDLGYSYQEIADALGYASRQAAHLAVKRAQKDYVAAQSRVDKPSLSGAPVFASRAHNFGSARGRAFPPIR
jgi:hypothetical protein